MLIDKRRAVRDLSGVQISTRTTITVVAFVVLLASCGEDDPPITTPVTPTPQPSLILFSPEGNRLNTYDPETRQKQTVIENHHLDPNGRDINGQVCFFPDGSTRFIAGEDTNQPNPPAAWGVFQLHGSTLGTLSATQIGRLVPTYQASTSIADPYGCGFLPDGRLLTTDIGSNASGDPTGQLIIWFPPLDTTQPRYCKLDVEIGTAQGILVSEGDVYVASARVEPSIWRFSGSFPTGDDAASGCGRTDSTGAPLVDDGRLDKTRLIKADGNVPTPNGVVRSPHGTFYVSSVLNGVIAEYDSAGKFVRRILRPVSGEMLPYPSTGTPLGLAIDAAGTLYYADLGLTTALEPGAGVGTVRRIRFVNGDPQPPDTIDTGLDFPDGLGLLLR
jgi:hypothetical protein